MSNSAFSPTRYPAVAVQHDEQVRRAEAAGFAAGYAEGLRAARQQQAKDQESAASERLRQSALASARIEQLVDVLNTTLRSTMDVAAPVIASAHHELVEASLTLAEAIVGTELAVDETVARSLAARVFENVDIHQALEIRLSPADCAALDDEVRAQVNVPIRADESLTRGDGLVRFSDGFLDARITSALDRVREALDGGEPL